MSEQVESVVLTPDAEAARLWRRAEEAFIRAPGSIAQLCEAVDLGVRVVEIGALNKLQSVHDQFPATIGTLLESLPPDIDTMRDLIHPPKSLTYVDVLDLLSARHLACISPQLHRGWEDRRESCMRSREKAFAAIGFSLDEDERKPLMLIGAYRNRLFSLPPPVRVVPSEVVNAFPSLAVLVDRLAAAARQAVS